MCRLIFVLLLTTSSLVRSILFLKLVNKLAAISEACCTLDARICEDEIMSLIKNRRSSRLRVTGLSLTQSSLAWSCNWRRALGSRRKLLSHVVGPRLVTVQCLRAVEMAHIAWPFCGSWHSHLPVSYRFLS